MNMHQLSEPGKLINSILFLDKSYPS